jgi:hypothetical protein
MRVPQITEDVRLAPVRALRAVFASIGQLLLAADRLATERAESPVTPEPAEIAQPADNGVTAGPAAAPARAARVNYGAGGGGRADMAGKAKKVRGKDTKAKDLKGKEAGAKAKDSKAKDSKGKDAKAKDLKVKDAKGKAVKAKDAKNKGAKNKDAKNKDERHFRSLDSTGNVRLLTPDDLAALEAEQAAPELPAEQVAAAPEQPPPVPGYDDLSLPSVRARLRAFDVPKLRELAEYERSNANRPDFVQMFERRIIKVEAGQA